MWKQRWEYFFTLKFEVFLSSGCYHMSFSFHADAGCPAYSMKYYCVTLISLHWGFGHRASSPVDKAMLLFKVGSGWPLASAQTLVNARDELISSLISPSGIYLTPHSFPDLQPRYIFHAGSLDLDIASLYFHYMEVSIVFFYLIICL